MSESQLEARKPDPDFTVKESMSDYEIIKLPVESRLRVMSDDESILLFDWVLSNQYERIDQLVSYVNVTTDHYFGADCTPESLKVLGEWFSRMIRTRPKSDEEIEKERAGLPASLHYQIDDREFTENTYSLILDIALYFSQVFLRNHPQIAWEICKSGSMNVDYNQPVLTGFGKKHLNPVRIIDVAAGGMHSGKHSGHRLFELYEIWKRYLASHQEQAA